MIPNDLYDCLKKVLCLKFDQEPPYDYILENLQNCFMKANVALTPQAPPSSMSINSSFLKSAASDKRQDDSDLPINTYVFEWNRTIANRFKNTLLAEKNELYDAVEVNLSMRRSIFSQYISIQSRDIRIGD